MTERDPNFRAKDAAASIKNILRMLESQTDLYVTRSENITITIDDHGRVNTVHVKLETR